MCHGKKGEGEKAGNRLLGLLLGADAPEARRDRSHHLGEHDTPRLAGTGGPPIASGSTEPAQIPRRRPVSVADHRQPGGSSDDRERGSRHGEDPPRGLVLSRRAAKVRSAGVGYAGGKRVGNPVAGRVLRRSLDVAAIALVLGGLFELLVLPQLHLGRPVPAPKLALTTLAGHRLELGGGRARPLFLDFFATWCEPCQQSIPLVQAFARAHPDVDVVSVDVGEAPAVVIAFAQTHPMRVVALDRDERAAHAFGIVSFPTMVEVNRGGVEQAKWVGYDPTIGALMLGGIR